MAVTPEERLSRLARNARKGFALARGDAGIRERTLAWLSAHPSRRPEVDLVWRECLSGEGALAEWLSGSSGPETWRGAIPLHSILASHPFADLPRWSIPKTSGASSETPPG
jgi:hypothetical protein